MRYHARDNTSGGRYVYQGRFKSFPIQDDGDFLAACRYVERNVLRAKLVQQAESWHWGLPWRWRQKAEPDPRLLSPWSISRSPNWVERVSKSLTKGELDAIRRSAQWGSSFGEQSWLESTVQRLGLASTLRPRGRPQIRFCDESKNNEC